MEELKELFFQLFNTHPDSIEKLQESGSSRKYFRLSLQDETYIGVVNRDREENKAFFEVTQAFLQAGIPCPRIIAIADSPDVYILEDLGDTDLLSYLSNNELRKGEIRELYQRILQDLLKIQTQVLKNLDTTYCYPRECFDQQSIQWDLNYFKYNFLKPAGIFFDEQLLENDFRFLIKSLLHNGTPYFMYRDFQSRNIMLHEGKPYYIDYQGGRKGTLYYDLASILFEGKVNLDFREKEHLLRYYYEISKPYHQLDFDVFEKEYYEFVLVRLLQVFGAYGFRGFMERKPLFIASVQYGIQNFEWLIENHKLPDNIPEIERCIKSIIASKQRYHEFNKHEKMLVKLYSFSYMKRGIPQDFSTHGGGFVFDCRFLNNPGQFEQYKEQTGNDKAVIDFFQLPENKEEVARFIKNTENICTEALQKYLSKDYAYISFGFGCTGGQHRSVYMVNKIEDYLKKKFGAHVEIKKEHMELNKSD